jgi:hypothetical protein
MAVSAECQEYIVKTLCIKHSPGLLLLEYDHIEVIAVRLG